MGSVVQDEPLILQKVKILEGLEGGNGCSNLICLLHSLCFGIKHTLHTTLPFGFNVYEQAMPNRNGRFQVVSFEAVPCRDSSGARGTRNNSTQPRPQF